MTIKDLKANYNVNQYEKGYQLTGLTDLNYLVDITLIKGYAELNGYPKTRDISVLAEQIADYTSKLQFPSYCYNPRYREGLFEELAVHSYMRKIGFEKDDDYETGSGGYKLNHGKNCYGYTATNIIISFYGLSNDFFVKDLMARNEVDIVLHVDNWSFVSVKTSRNAEEIVKAIDSLIKPLLVSEGTNLVTHSDKLTNVSAGMDITLNQISQDGQMLSQEYKDTLKAKLLELAETL